ncbi:MAG: cobaltochelatase subunit CobN [Candidatus Methanolliviera sp. GoM_oil]|nr:MAG: cobaltochelatase subunit CobN [Candidatus Methanolliviera sp. GoM_oil]
MNGEKTKITYVSFLGSIELVEALKEINDEYGDVIDLKVYGTHDIEKELVDLDIFKSDLATSHVVFIDGRGGDLLGQIISEVLSKTENTVLAATMGFGSYYGSPEEGILLRMGSIRSKAFTDKIKDKKIPGLVNSKIFRRFLKAIVKIFDEEIDVDAIIDRFDMTSIKDPQKLVDMIWKIDPIIRHLPKIGILKDYRNLFLINNFFFSASKENMKNFLLLLSSEYGNLKANVEIEPPIIEEENRIYHPDAPQTFRNLDDYRRWKGMEKEMTVGMVFYGGQFEGMSRPTVDLFIRTLECDANVICIRGYMKALSFHRIMEEFFFEDGKPIIDLFLWAGAYHRMTGGPMWAGPKELFKVLERLNVPVLAPFAMCMTPLKMWEKSNLIAPLDIACAVMAPELDGAIEPLPACAMASQIDSDTNLRFMQTLPIEDRCIKSCRRALRWIKLKKKENRDKKVAIVIYNYPPGEGNMGGGAGYLDVFDSLLNLLKRMREEGYTVYVPDTKEDLLNLFLDNSQVNTGDWTEIQETAKHAVNISVEEYLPWLDGIPEKPREKMLNSCGNPPGEDMTCDGKLLIPGVNLGNVFIGPQPSIVSPEKVEELITAYHDKSTAPHHQFLAFYKWIEEEFDAIVHWGTHGLLEFREGKEVAMSKDCFPDVLIGDTPHIYLYMVDDAAEATIAKRRSYALMISHASPAYMVSDVYDEYAELEDLIDEYYRAMTSNPERAKIVYEMIIKKAEEAHLEGSVEDIHEKIFEMKRSIIPKGLHCLGENLDEDGIVEYVTFAIRYDRGFEVRSMHRILSVQRGYGYEEMLKYPAKKPSRSDKTYAQILEEIEEEVKEITRDLLQKRDVDAVINDLDLKDREDIKKTLLFALDLIERTEASDEIGSLLRALDAGYILPCKGGDMVRAPEVLPTGRNIYQFDATKVPTAAAYERGVKIAEEVVQKYLEENGRYPESIGIVLWGFETTNTEGESVGEILRLIGVEVVSTMTDKRCGWGYFSDLRVISQEELGRPRIDVTINICGMFRDMFPNLLELLDKAFKMVSELDESEDKNLVVKHTKELKEKAADIGVDPAFAHIRTFGPEAGGYGTILPMLIDTSAWESEDELADEYIFGMKHAYGKEIHAKEVQKLFEFHASNVEVVSQVRDFTDFEITDLDHYYEFTGGFAMAVKKISGKMPEMYITDTTKEIIKTEDVKDAIERGSRTRTLNPKWIDAMLEHGYDGALNISDRVDNLMGFAATTGKVENWIWDEVCDRYVFDEETRKKMEESNPWAMEDMITRLFEAEKRGYWDASEERMEELKEIYLEVEGWIEERGDRKGKSLKEMMREKIEEEGLMDQRGEERSISWRAFLDKELKEK